MNIAFLVGGDYTTSLYIVTQDIAEHLRDQGHVVDYIFVEEPGSELKNNDKFIDIKGISRNSLKKPGGFVLRLLKNTISRHMYAYLLSGYFSRQLQKNLDGYDVVFIHGSSYLSFFRITTPHYCVLHSCKYQNFLGQRKGLQKKLYQRMYQQVFGGSRLLTVSDSVRLDMVDQMQARPESIETLYNGFDFDKLQQKAATASSALHDKPFIVAAGRPDRTKRFDVLLNAYAKTKRTHDLLIFGDGRKLPELKALARELGIEKQVVFKGFNRDVLSYFKQASAYILSSDLEGLPTVIVESLAVGTPVVATEVGGVRELLQGELSQWIVPRGDADALAEKIDAILEHPPVVGPENIAFLDYRLVSDKYLQLSEKLHHGLQ
ncbi:glycosyltransferase [Vibrio fluvialis]|uniref:glycosyltransferase n=1 Tax=Vibrio fluvialis TaxID=676 RepID=UPI00192C6E44|nr:glycosyltransferase [Vibrio fluvialis]MBL4280020.1 glycosyltransferase [Vibrio fluvialis]